MKRDHKANVVGPWAEQKLDALEKYLNAYSTALKKQNFRRIYIDAFAGSPTARIRKSAKELEPSPFFDVQDDSTAQDEFILGSPLRALNIDNGFHHHYFFDLDETRVATLADLAEERTDVVSRVGDCNPLIQELAPQLKRKDIRGVAFLDPYGAHLHWDTVKALADTGTMEVIINFPVAMAINRLITKSGEIPQSWKEQLDACFGNETWQDVSYTMEKDMFGELVISKNSNNSDALLELYLSQLREIFAFVSEPRLIRNTRNNPLYYLIWAGPNKLGLKIAEYILRQGEKFR
jgi:three-Cys-motif partner protein